MKILIWLCLLTPINAFAQTNNNSVTYWVSTKYTNCIDSGKSICHCQEQNDFLILNIDTDENKITIDPSIYYSWETFDADIKRIKGKTNSFTIASTWGLDTGSMLSITENKLYLNSPKHSYVFAKINVHQIDDWLEDDLWKQLGMINSSQLLKYSTKLSNGDSDLFLTLDDIANYISKGEISINCSDDYHYNELWIKDSKYDFFLVYETNSIKMYRIPERDRGEKVDVSSLKEYQLFYKSK